VDVCGTYALYTRGNGFLVFFKNEQPFQYTHSCFFRDRVLFRAALAQHACSMRWRH